MQMEFLMDLLNCVQLLALLKAVSGMNGMLMDVGFLKEPLENRYKPQVGPCSAMDLSKHKGKIRGFPEAP